jgi:hypothetical protein
MNWKHLATIVSIGGAIAAMFSTTPQPGSSSMRTSVDVKVPVQSRGDALALEATRLHARLTPDVAPRQPARNLFMFRSSARSGTASPAVAPVVAAPAAAVPAQPPLTLSGIAEDAGAEGPVRTAIISGGRELFLAKVGDSVTPRYRVTKISENTVELTDTDDGSVRRLAMK